MRLFLYEHITATVTDESSSLFIEGRAMRDALVADASRIDGVTVVPFDSEAGFDACVACSDVVWAVAPEFDGILLDLSKRVERAGRRWIGPTSDAITLTADKLSLSRHWQHHGIPTPKTWPADGPWRDHLTYPLVIKPVDGAGSMATSLVRDNADLDRAFNQAADAGYGRDRLIVQPFYAGLPCSVAFIHGQPLRPMAQHIDPEHGFAYRGGGLITDVRREDVMIRLAMNATACVTGLQGYYGVDLMLGEIESDSVAVEINPRLTTSYVGLRQACGENLAERVLCPERFTKPIAWSPFERLDFSPEGLVTSW